MKPYPSESPYDPAEPPDDAETGVFAGEGRGGDAAFLPPLPRAGPDERAQVAGWLAAQAGQATALARTAARLGALDERLRRGPKGWRHRLALIEAAELSWWAGERVTADRLGLWLAMRIGAEGEGTATLQRAAWAFRRLSGGPGPVADLAGFLGRHETRGGEPLADRIAAVQSLLAEAEGLHPVARAGLAFRLWPLAGIGPEGDMLEGAVVAARVAAAGMQGGTPFAPLAMGGAGALRGGGDAAERLDRWLRGMDQALRKAARHLDDIAAWEQGARAQAAALSGRTPPRLIDALRDWPLLTAPMAETLTGASRAAVQRNLAWFERHGLVHEVTGQGRFRVWQAV